MSICTDLNYLQLSLAVYMYVEIPRNLSFSLKIIVILAIVLNILVQEHFLSSTFTLPLSLHEVDEKSSVVASFPSCIPSIESPFVR